MGADILRGVEMTPVPPPAVAVVGDLYATHEGRLAVGGHTLRVYQLNDGRRVVDVGDAKTFLAWLFDAPPTAAKAAEMIAIADAVGEG